MDGYKIYTNNRRRGGNDTVVGVIYLGVLIIAPIITFRVLNLEH